MARKILLADDSVTAQNMGRKILADAGYEVITVNNGSAALKKIAELKPDLIVLDVYMPGYSGLEVCQRVKETGDTSRIPILLTVGKLEPFKPEEAKRVRADGYIVKPFEASELLSALTKLEDKIVPRAEASKPGRFARTIAVVEEGRYDKTMAADEDSGWRARIGFPSSKKKKEPETDDVDDSSIYNPVNKDLRTMIDRGTIDRRRPVQVEKPEDTRVDLAALAPPGLPKDVTPEEIAALAAAAAQIKGTGAGTAAENLASDKPSEAVAAGTPEQPQVASQPEANAPEAILLEARSAEAQAKGKDKDKEKERVDAAVGEPKADLPVEIKAEPKLEPVAEKPGEVTSGTPSPADVDAAIAPLDPVTYLSANTGSGSESRSADEPVTMAIAAAGTNGSAATPRWAAVATALLPEESTISLEHEMQKAYAAFAAAEVAYAPSAGAVAEPPAAVPDSVPQLVPAENTVASEPAPTVSAAVKNFEVAAAAPAEQSAAPLQLEAAPLQRVEPEAAPVSEVPAVEARVVETIADQSPTPEPPAAESASQEAASAPPAPLQGEQVQAEAMGLAPAQVEPAQAEQMLARQDSEEMARGEQKGQDSTSEQSRPEFARPEESGQEGTTFQPPRLEDHPSVQVAASAPAEFSESISSPNVAQPAPFGEAPAEQGLVRPPATEASPVPAEATVTASPVDVRAEEAPPLESVPQESASPESAPKDPVHKESEIAATTAAAWASWRRIRETGDTPSTASSAAPATIVAPSKIEEVKEELRDEQKKDEQKKEELSVPREAAAMAVAAGAEKAPEAIPAADSDPDGGDIANIVDSVLADLRPKIVAEISKKMGKKK